MFTIKYRFYNLAAKQSSDGPFFDQCESCHGPFEVVSQERDDGYIVIHGIDLSGLPMTFGPHNPPDLVAGKSHPRPIVWVMNEQGATIAKYDL